MSEKKNVLFIITDAQRYDHLSCYGNSVVKTPNIDRLASEGLCFENYFCTNPICMPNRATLLTGLYPNVHGVRSNGMILSKEVPTLTGTLRKRGWHTVAIGKIHHQFWMAPFRHNVKSSEDIVSWVKDKRQKFPVCENFPIPYYDYEKVELVIGNGTICSGHYTDWLEEKNPRVADDVKRRCKNYDYLFSLYCDPIPEELYNTTYVKERTINYLEEYTEGKYDDKPFYLHCSFPDPHYPIFPPKSFQNMYKPEDIELPESFDHVSSLYDHEYLGRHLKNPPFKQAFLRESTEEEIRKITALTYAAIGYVDSCVGQILARLENLGLSDNTIIVFSSDHGDLMGDHGLLFKGPCPFNGVLQLPLIWKVPGLTKKGSITKSLVSSIDYPKTILNLLEIEERYHPPDMQGYDITPVFSNPDIKIREAVYIENDEEIGPLKSRLRHLITEDYKLTLYEEQRNFGDIYDRKNDPLELNNLWYDKSFKGQRCKLIELLTYESLSAQSRYPKRVAGT